MTQRLAIALLFLAFVAPVGAQNKPKSDARWMNSQLGPTFASTFQFKAKGRNGVAKGLAIRIGDKGEAAVLFDTDTASYAAGWVGDFVVIKAGRDALLDNDAPGEQNLAWSTPSGPGWAKGNDWSDPRPRAHGPLPRDHTKFKGHWMHGDRVVLHYTVGGVDVIESPWAAPVEKTTQFIRSFEIAPSKEKMVLLVFEADGEKNESNNDGVNQMAVVIGKDRTTIAGITGDIGKLSFKADKGRVTLSIAPHDKPLRFNLYINMDSEESVAVRGMPPTDVRALTKPGQRRWSQILTVKGTLGKEKGPYVVDTITAPYDNPYKSIMHFGGFDFLKDGTAAVCTMEGDVWLVKGIDGDLDEITWQRYATGIYHALGLKIVDEKIYVVGRDQITRLHDANHDGEADYYENFNNDGMVTFGSHEYVTNLETDPQGNFYHIRCGNGSDHGGTLARISKDGSKYEVVATGFRNPDGMGVSPAGIITAADNQGDWVPSSRIDIVEQGGFYGHMGNHHRNPAPKDYDGPLCWIPHAMDNSSGSQVWVESNKWGPLEGQMLHLSYGKCTLFNVLEEKIEGVPGKPVQGGVVQFPLKFSSGIHRGRFSPHDGQLYLVGMKGWQTSGARDGNFQRVRYVGGKVNMPVALTVHENGVRLTFTEPLDRELAEDVQSYNAQRWNYIWAKTYGSKDWSVADPSKQGRDAMKVTGAKLSADGKTVDLFIEDMKPVMQMAITYNLESVDGESMKNTVYHTIHKLGPALK
ncbi:MAG: DUF6797 domain-containing protein [Phycisphaeraceae bacterium]